MLLKIEDLDVSFRNEEGETTRAAVDVNLTLDRGEVLGLVGESGSGKSSVAMSVVRLLPSPPAFWPKGRILFDGRDTLTMPLADLRGIRGRRIGVVFQDFRLMAFSVEENVASSDILDEEKVWQSLENAGIRDRVEEMPKKLKQTIYKLYEKEGMDISGGEEQKIAIARALYKEAPFVILDEPTAALDPIAENNMYLKYSELTKDRTAIYISHRLSSTRFCDRIVLIDNNKIAEIGTHDELMAKATAEISTARAAAGNFLISVLKYYFDL